MHVAGGLAGRAVPRKPSMRIAKNHRAQSVVRYRFYKSPDRNFPV